MQQILAPAAGNLSNAPVSVLVVLAVLVVVEVGLDVVALIDLYRRPTERVVGENKWIWLAIILLVNLIGPIVYLAAGRKPPLAGDAMAADSTSARTEDIVDSLYGPRDRTERK
jgi:hypothetical protein